MSMTFSGKVALVTGGAAGIGRATALAFAAEGLQVVVSDVDVAGGEGTVQLIRDAGGEAVFVRCDVTREAEVKVLMERTLGAYGRLDYAFNNAGIEIEKGKLAEGSEAEFDAIMGVNVKGVWLCMKHQLPLLLAQGGGAIVNTASVAGIGAAPKMSIYAASKHAVIGLVRALALETARTGVTVNAVCPGYTDTDLVAGSLDAIGAKTGLSREDALAQLVKDNPQGRLVMPDEVAAAAHRLFETLETSARPKDREEEAAKARARSAERFGAKQPA